MYAAGKQAHLNQGCQLDEFIGIDLLLSYSVVVLADKEDLIIYQKRLANKPNEILRIF
jgi:hypothetical protein